MWSPVYDAIDKDDTIALEKLLYGKKISCASLEGLLERAASLDKVAVIVSLIEQLRTRGCRPNLNDAAKEAVMHDRIGATLVLLGQGASNGKQLIDIATKSGYHGLAGFIRQKLGL